APLRLLELDLQIETLRDGLDHLDVVTDELTAAVLVVGERPVRALGAHDQHTLLRQAQPGAVTGLGGAAAATSLTFAAPTLTASGECQRSGSGNGDECLGAHDEGPSWEIGKRIMLNGTGHT